MTEKRFVYIEHKGADYILDTPNWELDFIEMLGDTLEAEEIVDLLNEQHETIQRLEAQLSHIEYRFTEYRNKVGKRMTENIHKDCENYSPKKDYCLRFFEENVSEKYKTCKEYAEYDDKDLQRRWSN